MSRDIEKIVERLIAEIPGIQVTQFRPAHLADDNGLWFIKSPGRAGEIQIESSDGSCPFIIESDFSDAIQHGQSIEEVVTTIKKLFE